MLDRAVDQNPRGSDTPTYATTYDDKYVWRAMNCGATDGVKRLANGKLEEESVRICSGT